MTVAIPLETRRGDSMTDITALVSTAVAESGVAEGLCLVSSPHTTAGITINENADPDVQADMMMEMGKLVPREDDYRHREGNSAAHLKATLTGLSATLPIADGRLVLGTWQGVYFCDYDGPRRRRVMVTVVGSPG